MPLARPQLKRKLRREEVIPFFEQQERCTVVLEACGAGHHWARMLTQLGHEAKLLAPEAARPFVKKGKKNDAADAAALCAAASRPEVTFVPVKSPEQQGVLALHSVRSLLVKQQTMLANAMRGLAAEFGLVVAKGIHKLDELEAQVQAEASMPATAKQAFAELHGHSQAAATRIAGLEAQIVAHARQDADRPPPGDDPRHRPDHRVADHGDGWRHHRLVQERAAFRRLAGAGAAAAFDRRQDAAGADHQGGQRRDPQAAGARRHLDGAPGGAVEQRGRGVAARRAGAASGAAGDGGAGEQDGAHRLGGDDARRDLPGEGACAGGCGRRSVTRRRGW